MYTYNATVIRVVDGDSVWLNVDVGFHMSYKYNFRLSGINTPELRSSDSVEKAAAYAAKARLEELLPEGKQVLINTSKPEKYGRWLVEIWAGDRIYHVEASVNELLLGEGHAVPY